MRGIAADVFFHKILWGLSESVVQHLQAMANYPHFPPTAQNRGNESNRAMTSSN